MNWIFSEEAMNFGRFLSGISTFAIAVSVIYLYLKWKKYR